MTFTCFGFYLLIQTDCHNVCCLAAHFDSLPFCRMIILRWALVLDCILYYFHFSSLGNCSSRLYGSTTEEPNQYTALLAGDRRQSSRKFSHPTSTTSSAHDTFLWRNERFIGYCVLHSSASLKLLHHPHTALTGCNLFYEYFHEFLSG